MTIKMSPKVEEPIGRSFLFLKVCQKTRKFAKISQNVRYFLIFSTLEEFLNNAKSMIHSRNTPQLRYLTMITMDKLKRKPYIFMSKSQNLRDFSVHIRYIFWILLQNSREFIWTVKGKA